MLWIFTVGRFLTNCYIITCRETREAIVIDPGLEDKDEAERVLNCIRDNSLKPKSVVNTHGHPDHTCGNAIAKNYNVPIMIHKDDAYLMGIFGKELAQTLGFKNFSPPSDILLNDGDSIVFGNNKLSVIHTPGHSQGSITLLEKNAIYTGDTLFAGSIGRTDFPESSEIQMKTSLEKLKKLPDKLAVYPGHGPATTLGIEKRENPFLTMFL
jgi:glyoxylase-like metal-dependent hydrolase (beta-lactamase superfamily II)